MNRTKSHQNKAVKGISKNVSDVPVKQICMKCWRDLVHECIGNDCPMWMEDFEYTDMPGEKQIGLGESKCALALKEKLKVYQSMMDILDAIDITEIDEEEFFRQMAERSREQPRKPSAIKGEAKKAVPAAKKQKKRTPS